MMAHLASEWSRAHQVDLVHHRPPLTRERIEMFSTDDFGRVTFRYVPAREEPESVGRIRSGDIGARDWHRPVSDGYDLFVNCTHWLPCFCHAEQAPCSSCSRSMSGPSRRRSSGLPRWKQLRHGAYHGVEWRRRWRRISADSRFPSSRVMDETPMGTRHGNRLSAGRCRDRRVRKEPLS